MKRLTELVEGPFRRTGRRAIREQNTPREKMDSAILCDGMVQWSCFPFSTTLPDPRPAVLEAGGTPAVLGRA